MSFIFERGIPQTINLCFLQDENVFQLRPIHNMMEKAIYLRVNFQRAIMEGKGVYSTTPKYFANHSQIYNSFYKPVEEPTQPANLLEACYYFGLNRQSLTRETSQIRMPRPSGNYCSVCKQEYKSYTDHVNSPEHQYKQNHNIFNLYMQEIKHVLNRDHLTYRTIKNKQEKIQIIIDEQ